MKPLAGSIRQKIKHWRLARAARHRPRLGEILLKRGIITQKQLDVAIREQSQTHEKLGKILFLHGWATTSQLASALRSQHKLLSSATVMLLQASSLALPSHHAAAIESHDKVIGEEVDAAANYPDYGTFNFGLAFKTEINELREQQAEQARAEALVATPKKVPPASRAHSSSDRSELSPDVAKLQLPVHLLAKADQYMPHVMEAAVRFDVPAGLILSVIHAESHFRNKARSSMNAQGLMQVVSFTAGAEAYPMVFEKRGRPSLSQLRDPRTNILLGTAYLKRLEQVYFGHVSNPEVRQAAVIAAYNVGPTKLRNIFSRHGEPRSVAGLKRLLAKYTPRETQNYLVKVRSRKDLYSSLSAKGVALAPVQSGSSGLAAATG